MRKIKQHLFLFISLVLLVSGLCGVQAAQQNFPAIGTTKGTIDRLESDDDGLYSIWFKVKGRMHEFMVREAKLKNGSTSDLQKGKIIQVKFKNREHSEMDDFFTADAIEITILKEGKSIGSK